MYVDCEYVTQANIEPKGQIDVNGDIVMGKNPSGSQVAVRASTVLYSPVFQSHPGIKGHPNFHLDFLVSSKKNIERSQTHTRCTPCFGSHFLDKKVRLTHEWIRYLRGWGDVVLAPGVSQTRQFCSVHTGATLCRHLTQYRMPLVMPFKLCAERGLESYMGPVNSPFHITQGFVLERHNHCSRDPLLFCNECLLKTDKS